MSLDTGGTVGGGVGHSLGEDRAAVMTECFCCGETFGGYDCEGSSGRSTQPRGQQGGRTSRAVAVAQSIRVAHSIRRLGTPTVAFRKVVPPPPAVSPMRLPGAAGDATEWLLVRSGRWREPDGQPPAERPRGASNLRSAWLREMAGSAARDELPSREVLGRGHRSSRADRVGQRASLRSLPVSAWPA
jgi:hypothetical protein